MAAREFTTGRGDLQSDNGDLQVTGSLFCSGVSLTWYQQQLGLGILHEDFELILK